MIKKVFIQIYLYPAETQRISTIFQDHMSAIHAFRKIAFYAGIQFAAAVHHLVSQRLRKRGHDV
jgi:hypothetical protein